MKQGHYNENWSDADGNPAGGVNTGRGFTISWQNGPLGRGAEREEPNGAFVEDIIDAVIRRINFYQCSQFACDENAKALDHLCSALAVLMDKTADREARGVEGEYKR